MSATERLKLTSKKQAMLAVTVAEALSATERLKRKFTHTDARINESGRGTERD